MSNAWPFGPPAPPPALPPWPPPPTIDPFQTWIGWVRFLGSDNWREVIRNTDRAIIERMLKEKCAADPHLAKYEITNTETKPGSPFR